ncbi:MAG TPA: response regulator [Thermoanaerobaculia bacterium]|nr:response regulator [Thermoanaerobaculia bacterium]
MNEDRQVLVVDDEPEVRQLLGAVLRRHQIRCDFAADGEEVLEMLAQNRYCVLLLDLMMPYIDGIGVLDEMKASGDTTPVIVVTAAGQSLIRKLDSSAVRQVVQKPFDVNTVAQLVTEICNGRSSTS